MVYNLNTKSESSDLTKWEVHFRTSINLVEYPFYSYFAEKIQTES